MSLFPSILWNKVLQLASSSASSSSPEHHNYHHHHQYPTTAPNTASNDDIGNDDDAISSDTAVGIGAPIPHADAMFQYPPNVALASEASYLLQQQQQQHQYQNQNHNNNNGTRNDMISNNGMNTTPVPPPPLHHSFHAHELKLRKIRHQRQYRILQQELHHMIQRDYNGDFDAYVRDRILNERRRSGSYHHWRDGNDERRRGSSSNAASDEDNDDGRNLDAILQLEMQKLLQQGLKRDKQHRKWLKHQWMPRYSAIWEGQFSSRDGTAERQRIMQQIEEEYSDDVLKERQMKGMATSQKGNRSNNGNKRSEGRNRPFSSRASSSKPTTPQQEDPSLRYTRSQKANHNFSHQYRLERSYLFEKKVMKAFDDPIMMQSDTGTNIFEDPFGLGFEPPLDAYHPHHFATLELAQRESSEASRRMRKLRQQHQRTTTRQ